jgi:hypothetical protein
MILLLILIFLLYFYTFMDILMFFILLEISFDLLIVVKFGELIIIMDLINYFFIYFFSCIIQLQLLFLKYFVINDYLYEYLLLKHVNFIIV